MIIRLVRRIADDSLKISPQIALNPSINKILEKIRDQNSYTKENIMTIVSSYYFLFKETSTDEEKILLARHPDIQSSLRNLEPFIRDFPPIHLTLLVKNLSLLHILKPSIWNEIEIAILKLPDKDIPLSIISSICEGLRSVGKKNESIWNFFEDRLINKVYSKESLNKNDLVRVYTSFCSVDRGSEKLFSLMNKNIRECIEEFNTHDLFFIIEYLSFKYKPNTEIIKFLADRAIQVIEKSDNPSYYNLLRYLLRSEVDEVITRIEELYKPFIKNERLTQLSSLALSYNRKEFLTNEKRKNFVSFILKNVEENRAQLVSSFSNREIVVIQEVKIAYTSVNFKLDYPDKEILRIYNDSKAVKINAENYRIIIREIEKYLKNKKLIS